MNDQIVKLFGAVLVLFALLVVFTSRWTVFQAHALNHNPLNRREAIIEERIERGPIRADNGELLAKSVPAGGGTWKREYPQGPLYAQTVGYWRGGGQDAGLESYYASELEGTQTGISSVFGPLSRGTQVGDTLETTLVPDAQIAARNGLAGRTGAVVALDPRSGAVLALYADPSFDPNATTIGDANCRAVSCELDRATQSGYPPGSTFKVLTATAAIDSGRFTPSSQLSGASPQTFSGVPLANDAGDPRYGEVSLTEALTQSINTVWARVGVDLGTATLTDYMKRYGFYARAPIDLPGDELRPADVLSPAGDPYPAGSPDEDVARIAIGQGGLAVSPLQMAMVASTVADGGKLMAPHLAARFVSPDGSTARTIDPHLVRQVMSARSASAINGMMRDVVDEGTGTPARLASGIEFAGKTGTASVGAPGEHRTDPWFIGFAPANDPTVAIAVVLENTDDGYGGQIAGPIASSVVQTLLADGK